MEFLQRICIFLNMSTDSQNGIQTFYILAISLNNLFVCIITYEIVQMLFIISR